MNNEQGAEQRRKILVVDDSAGNLQILMKMLTEHGYAVFPASDGELALTFVRSTLPDLILLDIRMPGMDGYEVCRRLKANERTRSIPVIFISVLEDERDKVQGFREGAVDYITKPFQPEEVLARIQTHLSLREFAGQLEQKVAERTEELLIANEQLKREVSERKKADQALRLNAERMEALLRLNQMTDATLDEITSFAFEAAVRVTRSRIGYLAFMNEDETLLDMRFCSREAAAGCGLRDVPRIIPVGKTGLWGEAARQRRPIITNDYHAPNPWKKGTPEGHIRITRHLNLPVIAGGKIVLVAGVGNKEEDYDEGDINHLSLLMQGMWRLIERKRAEEALVKSEARYRRIVDTASEGIWVVGPDAMTTFVNSRMSEMLGRSGEEMLGRPLSDFMFEEDAPDYPRKLNNRRRGISESYERRFRHKDGRTVWTHVSATPIFDDDNHFNGSFAMFTDITERKRTEEAIRASEQELRALFAAMNDVVFVINSEGRYLKIPETNPSLLYKRKEELLGKTLHEVFSCAQADIFQGYVSQTLATRRPVNIEFEMRIGDKDFWFNATASPMSEDAVVIVVRNSTERKRAEEEIRRLKNYLSNIIDSMPSILVGMDHDETVTQWNREAEKISGISVAEAVGRPITELLPDFSPWIEAMRSEIELHCSASMEKLLIEKDGERHFYDLMLYPLVGNGVEGAVVRIEDSTERARIQELMIQTEKMMSVGGLAAGMAHEINNPLGIIIQALQNIERRVSPGLPANRRAAEELGISMEAIHAYFGKRQINEFIDSIREASLRAARIIANMLQFSRCAGTDMQPVSPEEIIGQALELAASDYDLKKKYDFRTIEIIRDYAPDMPAVPMVAVETEQVMLNLLKNAAQAMIVNPPERRPRITLRLRREERYALIEVEDNGPGMKEEVRRRVFEPFFTTKEPGVGTGLGLSVSYMIVTQNHKGLMEVESKPGKGARFSVRLPLSKENIHE